jgi:protein TonB
MKFYVLSFLLHLILVFSVIKLPAREIKLDSKNVVVYLNELKIEGKGNPEPAPLKNLEKEEKIEEKKIERKEIKKVEKKKVERKIEKKKVVKKVVPNKKRVEKVIEDVSDEVVETQSKVFNPLDGLVKDGTGIYIGDQRSSQGIGYRIKREVDPIYPQMAKKVGFKDEVVIQTKFLVGLDGKVEEIIFLNDFNKYGFQKEVEKALRKWEFEPIIYHGKNIKMYFYKDFRFNVKNKN